MAAKERYPRQLHLSPPSRHQQQQAREHLASLIRRHGPPTPASSSSSLRKLTSTSPINTSFLPPEELATPPASPPPAAAAAVAAADDDDDDDDEETYESPAGSQPIPIPIPRASSKSSFEDLPITPLTGRFEYGLYLTEDSRPSVNNHHNRPHKKSSRRKVSTSSTSASAPTPAPAPARSSRKRMPHSSGPSLTMPAQSGPVSPKPAPKDNAMYLANLPRFHPAVYQSPNSTPNAALQNATSNHHPRSFGYRVASGGGSREALKQYRELVAANVSQSFYTEVSAPRLDPLGSPGPVTPLVLEETDGYMAARPNAPEGYSPGRKPESVGERERRVSPRSKDNKGR